MHIDWDILFKCIVILFGGLMSITGFLSARTLNKIDANQQELFNRLHLLEKDFYELRGEHKSSDHMKRFDDHLYQQAGVYHGQISNVSERVPNTANVSKAS